MDFKLGNNKFEAAIVCILSLFINGHQEWFSVLHIYIASIASECPAGEANLEMHCN
jgi:hypothetical protein